MKNLLKFSLLFLFLIILGCSKDENPPPQPPPQPTPTTGSISGRITLPSGAGGDINNTRVAIYASSADWSADRVLKFVTTNSNGNYAFNNVTPGTYYMDAWKDNNNNTLFDTGDFWGVYGSGWYPNYQVSPFSVAAGQTTTINFQIFIIP
jgi:hypothetical protein